MRQAVRSWLLAAGLPLFFGQAVGCDGNAGDDALHEDPSAANPAPGASDSPAPPEATAPGAPAAGAPGATPGETIGAVPAPDPAKPRSYTRDLRAGFQEEAGLTGEHTYLVHFKDSSLASYDGGVAGLAATSTAGYGKLDARSPQSLAYKSYLLNTQAQEISTIQSKLGRTVKVMRHYTTAANAVTARLTQDEAKQISLMPGVAFVERDQEMWPETDRGPLFIGAASIWDGSVTDVPSQGEGMTIGVIDSGLAIQVELDGVTTIHPSFDAIGGDGYVHTNPLGDGVYLGACVQHPEWCSDKLIGVYAFLQGQPNPGVDPAAPNGDILWVFKDTSGHGSHTASTAGGNVLFDVAAVDAEGNPSTFEFARISGVAPHANLVSLKVCAPSCFSSDTVAAVEQAIEDGVIDVLNYSISSPGGSPWGQSVASAFLSARAAGIFVAASAGNNGPTAGTAGRGNSAPWVAATAALSHDRRFPNKQLTGFSGGAAAPPPAITGLGMSGGFTGRIVYAGNFRVGSPGQPNFDQPQQCLAPFPPGTFAPDMIVVCDRGTAARTDKGRFVRDGGAGGFVLANITGGSNTVDADPHVIPAININIAQGNALKAWLASGTGHMATITPASQPVADPAVADIMAAFSSRGPYTDFDILAPSVATPGL
ncbi:MAG TPA: S8 family serine peptidase, partial [Haliangium sp.]|nr:S8 family serine peptidase [Haliangium sp.]